MRKVVLYIAMSVDGYIADTAGSVERLGGVAPDYQGDYGYGDFAAAPELWGSCWRRI